MKKFTQLASHESFKVQFDYVKPHLDVALTIMVNRLKLKDYNVKEIWEEIQCYNCGILPVEIMNVLVRLKKTYGRHLPELTMVCNGSQAGKAMWLLQMKDTSYRQPQDAIT